MSDTTQILTRAFDATAPTLARDSSRVRDYVDLLKPRVMSLVVFTGLVGVLIAPGRIHPFTAALAVLLQQGIGDTIRISLTPEPNGDRTREVIVAQEILQTMGLRSFTPLVTACPGCGRTTSTFFQVLADKIQSYLRAQMPVWKVTYPGAEKMTVAVMGCVVNGPGESKHANIGISLPGNGEAPSAPVFIDGEKAMTLRGDNIAHEFIGILDRYVATKFTSRAG